MAQQQAKFIDVTKTYIPVDPFAFPKSMQGTGKEDNPEARIPVVAYDGRNFLPTSYGYKSYFGTRQHLDIDAFIGKVDHIFMFQNEQFKNLLIVLADNGIFCKDTNNNGPWIQGIALVSPPTGTHYEWTYCVIADKLYCYQQNWLQYWKISSSLLDPGLEVEAIIPSFLNMQAQQGIFRAGGRLGFWDSTDSVSWSNLDDFSDFTPDLETLAGNTLFSDVNGRIITILPHGEGFIIYASKSIVFIAQDTQATFQWNPKVILPNTGIAFPEEATVGVPDTMHFVSTNVGLFKIDKTSAEIIIPEVLDYFPQTDPIYPRVLEGRYLFLPAFSPDYLSGTGNFTLEVVPEDSYTFPGGGEEFPDVVDKVIKGQESICKVIKGLEEGEFPDQQPPTTSDPDTEQPALPGGNISDKLAGTVAKPIWKCYISNNVPLEPDAITFGQTPCAVVDPNGVPINLSPNIGNAGKISSLTQTSANKKGLLGSDVYVDGNWTIERFIAVQTAIWEKEKKTKKSFIDKILNRAGEGQKKQPDSISCIPSNTGIPTKCEIGDFAVDFSDPEFGFSGCQFWLTRFAISAIKIEALKFSSRTCDLIPAEYSFDNKTWIGSWAGIFATPDTSERACQLIGSGGLYSSATSNEAQANYAQCYNTPGLQSNAISKNYSCPVGWTPSGTLNEPGDGGLVYGRARCMFPEHYEIYDIVRAYNDGEVREITPTPETAYCEIVGWKYTANDGTTKTVAAGVCQQPAVYPGRTGIVPTEGGPEGDPIVPYEPDGITKANPINLKDGTVCTKPWKDVTIPGTPVVDVVWPDTEIVIPSGNFLLQRGSIAPVYPTFFGALVYDLYLKKWGRYAGTYKKLLDYRPLNDSAGNIVPAATFGIMAGVIKSDGFVYIFDAYPTTSYLTYGKVGYYRLGKTSVEEVQVHFRTPSTGRVKVATSLQGRLSGTDLEVVSEFEGALDHTAYGGYPGSWHEITISGLFDIQYLEYRGFIQGRR